MESEPKPQPEAAGDATHEAYYAWNVDDSPTSMTHNVVHGTCGSIAALKILLAERDSLRAEVERLRDQEQKDMDSVCHYRNLACSYGAKPQDMLNEYDREVAAKWATMLDHTEGWHNDVPDCWERLEQAEARAEWLEKALRAYHIHIALFHDLEVVGTHENCNVCADYTEAERALQPEGKGRALLGKEGA